MNETCLHIHVYAHCSRLKQPPPLRTGVITTTQPLRPLSLTSFIVHLLLWNETAHSGSCGLLVRRWLHGCLVLRACKASLRTLWKKSVSEAWERTASMPKHCTVLYCGTLWYKRVIDCSAVGRLRSIKWSPELLGINELSVYALVKGHVTSAVNKLSFYCGIIIFFLLKPPLLICVKYQRHWPLLHAWLNKHTTRRRCFHRFICSQWGRPEVSLTPLSWRYDIFILIEAFWRSKWHSRINYSTVFCVSNKKCEALFFL